MRRRRQERRLPHSRQRSRVLRPSILRGTDFREVVARDMAAVPRAGNIRIAEVHRMADRQATWTEQTDLADRLVRVLRVVRVTVGVLGAMQVLAAALTVADAMAEAMRDREPAEDLLRKLPQRIWRKSATMTRGASAARRIISAPERITSTRRKKH